MEVYRAEKILYKMFSVMFHPLLIPSYIFVFISLMTPVCRLYFLIYPKIFLLTFFIELCSTSLMPIIYIKYISKQQINLSSREILVFSLIINIANYLLFRKFLTPAVYLPVNTSFVVTFIALTAMIIADFLSNIDIKTSAVSVLFVFTLLFSPLKSFGFISIILLLYGLILSLYLVNGKSTMKQTVSGLITGIVTIVIFLIL